MTDFHQILFFFLLYFHYVYLILYVVQRPHVSSLLTLHASWEWTSGHEAWLQAPLYTEPLRQPPFPTFYFVGGTEIGALMLSLLSSNLACDYGCVKLEQWWSLGWACDCGKGSSWKLWCPREAFLVLTGEQLVRSEEDGYCFMSVCTFWDARFLWVCSCKGPWVNLPQNGSSPASGIAN